MTINNPKPVVKRFFYNLSNKYSSATFIYEATGWFVSINLQWGLIFFLLFGLEEGLFRNRARGYGRKGFFLLAFFLPPALMALFVFNLESSADKWIIYFFHLPVSGAFAWWTLARRISPTVFWVYAAVLWLILALVISIGFAQALYVLVEKPSFELAERRKPSSKAGELAVTRIEAS